MDGNGGCCIARWADGGGHGHGSKMDMIMLKFRPIAPKPVSDNGSTVSAACDGTHGIPYSEGRPVHVARTASRGRKKKNNNNNGIMKKRKSSSPSDLDQDQKRDVTLLPLFPEAPDLSPTGTQLNLDHNNISNEYNYNNYNYNSYNYNNNMPMVEDNYRNCHGSGW